MGGAIVLLFLFAIGVTLYFIPSMLALFVRHRQTPAIILINFFLGWTLIGWVGALVWVFVRDAPRKAQG